MGKTFTLRNGLLLLSTEAPGGVYNSTQLKKISSLCDGDTAIVKATEDQRLALFVKAEEVQKFESELRAVGLGVRHYQDGLHQPVNCLGELCAEHEQDAMGTSMDLTRELAALQLEAPLKIGINGCGRCCVATHTLDISIIGDAHGYRVSLGGKNSQIPEMASFMAEGVPAAKLPKLIAKVVAAYKELAKPDESLQDVMERAGSKRFVDALAPYSQDAADHDDPFGALGGAASEDAADAGLNSADVENAAETTAEIGMAPEEETTTQESLDFMDVSPELVPDELGHEELEISPSVAGMEKGLDAEVPIGDAFAEDFAFEELSPEEFGTAEAEDAADMTQDARQADPVQVDESDELSLDSGLDSGLEPMGVDDMSFEGASVEELDGKPDSEHDELNLDDFSPEELSVDAAQVAEDLGELSLDAEVMELGEAAMGGEELVPVEVAESDDFAGEFSSDWAAETGDAEADAVAAAPSENLAVAELEESAAASPDDEVEDEFAAEEVGEEEADAFEARLNESIAEEESLPEVEDVNSADRLEAVQLVELSSQEDDESDVEIADLEQSSELASGALSSEVEPAAPAASTTHDGFVFTGLDLASDGRLALQFASGANVSIDPRSLAVGERRDLIMGGRKVVLRADPKGLNVEVDGVAIFLPRRAA